jgi:uncharacterized membrane protein YgdD (TMEM256/DUF423 family)
MRMNVKLMIAGVAGFVAVALAAFGAHGLPHNLPALQRHAFETAGQLHLAHALLLSLIALAPASRMRNWSFAFVFAGILLFAGSLYIYALTGARMVTIAAPVGGLSLMAGWLLLAVSGAETRKD